MKDSWYYSIFGQKIGPITLHQLQERLSTFPSASDVLVWHQTFAEWLPATDVADLLSGDRSDIVKRALAATYATEGNKTTESERHFGAAGRLLGVFVILLGCGLSYLSITDQGAWTEGLLGFSSRLVDALPGVVLFIIGLLMTTGTRYKATVE